MSSYTIPDEMRPWVEATAPTLTAAGWSELRRAAAGFYDNMADEDGSVLVARGRLKGMRALWYDGGQLLTDRGRALLAYVDEIVAGLTTKQRNALRGGAQHPRPKLPAMLGEYGGYANAYFQPTRLGAEVARVLGGGR
jgi:hypothetical protein